MFNKYNLNQNINNKIINKEEDYEEQIDKLCIICIEENGIKVLCNKCKYKYCEICSNKINNKCSICVREKNKNNNYALSNDYLNMNNPFIYENMEDYEIGENIFFSLRYLFICGLNIFINIIIGISWIIIIFLFGFVCIKFIRNIILQIIKYIFG